METEILYDYRYIVFFVCGILGYFGSLRINEMKITFKDFFIHGISAILIGIIGGIVGFYFIKDVEISGVISVVSSMLYVQITNEMKQIIDKTDQIFDKVVDKKLVKKEEDEKKE